jgi:hypothetical protein
LIAAALVVAAGGASGGGEPRAEGPTVVLVRMTRCCPELACRGAEDALAAELGATSLAFEPVDGDADDAADGGERLAGRLGEKRGAAIRLFREPGKPGCAMEVWAQGGGAGERTYRRKPLPDTGDPDAEMNAAIAAAEAVFAGLLELRLITEEALRRGPPPAAPEPDAADAGPEPDAGADEAAAPAGAVAAPPAAPDRRLGLGLGAGIVWSPGGVGPRGAVRLAFDARFVPWLTVRVDGWVTVIGEDVTVPEARATFDAATFRLTAFYEFIRRGVLRPALGITGAGIAVWTNGVGAVEYVGDRETALAGYLGGSGRLAIVLSRWFRLEIGAAVGAVMPEVHVRFAGESVARFGRPLVEAFAQLELSFY